jgi:hypothetical protein
VIVSRRTLLKSLLAYSCGGLLLHPFSAFASATPHQGLVVGSSRHAVRLNLDTFEADSLETNFVAHSFCPASQDGLSYFGLAWDKQAAAVDFRNQKVRPLPSGDTRVFFGHSIYNARDNIVLVDQVDTKTGFGHLVGYDPETLKIVSDWQICPGILHECRYLPDGNIMITSGGVTVQKKNYNLEVQERRAPTALAIIDPKDGRTLHQIQIEAKDETLNHFILTKRGQILALSGWPEVSDKFMGHIYISDTLEGPLRKLEWPKSAVAPKKGEMLSAALNEDHTMAVVTCPFSKTISFVDMVEGRIVGTVTNSSNWVAYSDAQHGFISAGSTPHDTVVAFTQDKPAKSVYSGDFSHDPAKPDRSLFGVHALPIMIEA